MVDVNVNVKSYRVDSIDDKFIVVDGGVTVAGPFDTHAGAWRWIDRAMNEPVGRREAAMDWAARKFLKS